MTTFKVIVALRILTKNDNVVSNFKSEDHFENEFIIFEYKYPISKRLDLNLIIRCIARAECAKLPTSASLSNVT